MITHKNNYKISVKLYVSYVFEEGIYTKNTITKHTASFNPSKNIKNNIYKITSCIFYQYAVWVLVRRINMKCSDIIQ